MSGLFGGLSNVSSSGGRSDMFPLGTHDVELEEAEGFMSQAGNPTIRIKAKVVASDNPDVQIGKTFVQILTLGKKDWQITYFQRDLKGFLETVIETVTGQTPEQLIEADAEVDSPEEEDKWWAAMGSDILEPAPTPQYADATKLNPECVGLRLRTTVVEQNKVTKPGETFNKQSWSVAA